MEAFEVELDGRGERVRLLEEQVAEQRAAVESGRQELALAQDELAAARVSLEQEFEAKSADVASREESLAQRSAGTDERASALQAQSDELAAAVANLHQDRQALEDAEQDGVPLLLATLRLQTGEAVPLVQQPHQGLGVALLDQGLQHDETDHAATNAEKLCQARRPDPQPVHSQSGVQQLYQVPSRAPLRSHDLIE